MCTASLMRRVQVLALPQSFSQVDVQHVLAARSSLMRAGANLWQPLDVNRSDIGDAIGGGDDEVNRALEQLLTGGNRNQVGGREDSNCWSGETAIIRWEPLRWEAGKPR